jgi:hypothetical protein
MPTKWTEMPKPPKKPAKLKISKKGSEFSQATIKIENQRKMMEYYGDMSVYYSNQKQRARAKFDSAWDAAHKKQAMKVAKSRTKKK